MENPKIVKNKVNELAQKRPVKKQSIVRDFRGRKRQRSVTVNSQKMPHTFSRGKKRMRTYINFKPRSTTKRKPTKKNKKRKMITKFCFNQYKFIYDDEHVVDLDGPIQDESLVHRMVSNIERCWKITIMRSGLFYLVGTLIIIAVALYFTKIVPLICLCLIAALYIARNTLINSVFSRFIKDDLQYFNERYRAFKDAERGANGKVKEIKDPNKRPKRFIYLDYQIDAEIKEGKKSLSIKVWNPTDEPYYETSKILDLSNNQGSPEVLLTEEKRLNTETDLDTLRNRREQEFETSARALAKTRKKLKKMKEAEEKIKKLELQPNAVSMAEIILDDNDTPRQVNRDRKYLDTPELGKQKKLKIREGKETPIDQILAKTRSKSKKKKSKKKRKKEKVDDEAKNFNLETLNDVDEDMKKATDEEDGNNLHSIKEEKENDSKIRKSSGKKKKKERKEGKSGDERV